VYSIDECFLDLGGFSQDLSAYGVTIADTVKQGTGIPVTVGIAPTKTLAKLANKLAKKGIAGHKQVLVWDTLSDPNALLEKFPVTEVWGISSAWGARLASLGILNTLALKQADPKWIRKHFGVVMERIVRELNGMPCIPLEMIAPARQQILTSRSFGERLTQLTDLRAAVSAFASRSAEKLRSQQLCALSICVFIHTSPFDPSKPAYSNAVTIRFDQPSQDTGWLIHCALSGLARIFKPGYHYQRAGVLMPDLIPAGMQQLSLFSDEPSSDKSGPLMTTIDAINRIHGRHTIRYASDRLSNKWQMRQNMKSQSYTTDWSALPVAKTS